jgi:heme oxygenase (biliverdin-producing, ferredoxin)
MPSGLAAQLRHDTTDLHRQAERAGVMRDILAGRVDPGAYIRLLRALYPVYVVLEQELVRHPEVAPVPLAGLARAPALAADLAHLAGAGWERRVAPVPAGEAYAARIRSAAAHRPVLLAAHAYVRYLGDLSGGQTMGRLVARGLGLAGGAGVAFYRFGMIGDLAACKRAFRAGLDALPLTEGDAALLIAEARAAFAANIRIFEAVGSPA